MKVGVIAKTKIIIMTRNAVKLKPFTFTPQSSILLNTNQKVEFELEL